MQWLLIAVIHIAVFDVSCASAENGKGQISNVFEAFGYSPACVASALTSCEYSSTKELSVDVVDSIEATKSLLQEIKSEVQTVRQDMKSQGENSSSVLKTFLQDMKFEIENSTSIVKSLLQEMKSEVQAVLQEMKSEVQAVLQEINSGKENSASVAKTLLQEMKPEMGNSMSEVNAIRQEMKSERENSTSIVKSLLQEMKTERENEKNSFEILLENLENITHRISTLEVILQEATSERKNVSHSLADMKTFLLEMKTEQENDPATTVNNSCVNVINPQKNCADLRVLGDELSGGVQTVYPYLPNQKPVVVYCDQVTDGGGWTVIQSRSPLPIRENFNRSWNSYVKGFGDLKGEFWLGLDNIHALTSSAEMMMRVDLEDAEGERAWAQYGIFHVGDAASKYVLTIGNYSGDAGDGMIRRDIGSSWNSNAMKFSTFDNDNDLDSSYNCAKGCYGGWWFNDCAEAHLNGLPIVGSGGYKDGIFWVPFRKGSYSLKKANMKIRPVSLGF